MWLEGEDSTGQCDEVAPNRWLRRSSNGVDVLILADGPEGSGLFWQVTLGIAPRHAPQQQRGVCFTATTVGARTLGEEARRALRFFKGPNPLVVTNLPWVDDLDADGRADVILWDISPSWRIPRSIRNRTRSPGSITCSLRARSRSTGSSVGTSLVRSPPPIGRRRNKTGRVSARRRPCCRVRRPRPWRRSPTGSARRRARDSGSSERPGALLGATSGNFGSDLISRIWIMCRCWWKSTAPTDTHHTAAAARCALAGRRPLS